MPVLALGVSYRRAPLALLERLAFPSDSLPKAYHHLTNTDGIRGGVLLSTCNRVEVYADVEAYHGGFQAVKRFLSEAREIAPEELGDPLYSHYEDQAAEHLFSVAAGMDSMVLGEPQILSQVRQAYKTAEAEGTTGPLLRELFRRAIRAGRRVRSETELGASPGAFVEAGAAMAGQALGGLGGKTVLIVGAGKMSELAASLLGEVAGSITVLGRRRERAERLAHAVKGSAGTMTEIEGALHRADLVVSATNSARAVIRSDAVERAMRHRENPLFVIDLAVPRDADPDIAGIEGVSLVDIEGLRASVHRADASEVERARLIVGEEVGRFAAWRRASRLAPVIQAVFDRGERIRRGELDRLRARLSGLTEEQRAAVETATKALVSKLLHRPVTRAKELYDRGESTDRLLADLFELEPPPPPE